MLLIPALGVLWMLRSPGRAADSQLVVATVYRPAGPQQDSVSLTSLAATPAVPEYSGPSIDGAWPGTQFVPSRPSVDVRGRCPTILGCLPTPRPTRVTCTPTRRRVRSGSPQHHGLAALAAPDLAPRAIQSTPLGGCPWCIDLGTAILAYDRPWRGGATKDYRDQVQEPRQVAAHDRGLRGPVLTVASTCVADDGGGRATVTFSATVTPSAEACRTAGPSTDGAQLDAGSSAGDVRPPGQFNVTVQVSTPPGRRCRGTIPITVGTPTAPAADTQQYGRRTNTTPTADEEQTPPAGKGRAGKPKPGKSRARRRPNGATATRHHRRHATEPGRATPHDADAHAQPRLTSIDGTSPTSGPGGRPRRPQPRAFTRPSDHPAGVPIRPSLLKSRRRPGRRSQAPRVAGRLVSDVTRCRPTVSPLVHTVPAAVAPRRRRRVGRSAPRSSRCSARHWRSSCCSVLGAGARAARAPRLAGAALRQLRSCPSSPTCLRSSPSAPTRSTRRSSTSPARCRCRC